MKKKLRVIKVDVSDLAEKAKDTPLFEKFLPIENTHRIRVIFSEQDNIRIYSLELVDVNYKTIQKIYIGKNDFKLKEIKKKLLELGVQKEVVNNGIAEFRTKYIKQNIWTKIKSCVLKFLVLLKTKL